jgi:hypothetical protein
LKKIDSDPKSPRSPTASNEAADSNADDDETSADRGVAQREYLKEILISHPIWQDGNFWEQILWQCAIEQVSYSIDPSNCIVCAHGYPMSVATNRAISNGVA